MAVPIGYVGAYENNIRVANSATVNTTNLNALIASMSGSGGGTIWFNEPGAYFINGTITWRTGVSFKMTSGSQFSWSGGSTGDIFTTRAIDVPLGLDMECYIDEGSSFNGVIFHLHSCQNCHFKLRAYGNNAGSTFLFIAADSTAGEFPGGGRNFVFNTIDAQHRYRCGTGLLMWGLATGGFGGQPQGVTLNTFYNFQACVSVVNGIRIDHFVDNNTFSGNTYVAINGMNGVGLIVNPVTPTTFSHVYNNTFEQLSIDTFGTGLARWGTVLNNCQAMHCNAYHQDPVAENGSFSATNATSYYWKSFASGGTIFVHQKGLTTGL